MMLIQLLEWIFMDVAQCFFPVIKNEDRQFRWPGLGPAMWCLLLEASCFVLASILLVIMTLGYGFLLVTKIARDDKAIQGLPLSSGSTRGQKFTVTKLDAKKGQVTPAIIQSFMARSEPVIIKNLPNETFSALHHGGQYSPPLTEAEIKTGLLINTYVFPRALGAFGQWIRTHVQRPLLAVIRFSGNYKTSVAHIDGSPPTNNIYYLSRGRKRVWICPRQYNHLLNLKSISNSLMIPGSEPGSPYPLDWIQTVPGVWAFELEAGDVLIFNNAACVHKFENLSENPEAFSARVLGIRSDGSPVMAKHWILNWEQARRQAFQIVSCNKTVAPVYWVRK